MTSCAKRCSRTILKSSASWRYARSALSVLGIALALPAAVLANPLGDVVTSGSAAVSHPSSNYTTVKQTSESVVIDWSSFNVGAGQATQFVQPNASAIAVNRVGGANASQILGTLDANGRIVLINGNGVLFGKDAQVNVGALIATSTDGSDKDVLSGNFTIAGKQSARVVNQGQINAASGGLVALVAPSVTNTGIVNAKLGTVALGAANKFTVDFAGGGLVSFAAQGDVNAQASASNMGTLSGANVSMTAHAAEGVATGVVNMNGTILAQGAYQSGGTIVLDAGNGALITTGTLNAAGTSGGGSIETSGQTASISGHITAGQGGQWKVDPEDLTIDSNAAATINGALNVGTSVQEQTTSGAASGSGNQTAGAGDIIIASGLSWNTTATLTLDAYHSLNINAPIAITGAGNLVLQYNDAATDGALNINSLAGADVAYSDVIGGTTQGSLTINSHVYTLENNLAQLAADIATTPAGNFALANSYNASGDNSGSPYSGPVIATTFAGNFEGLGNTILNLSIDSETSPADQAVGLFRIVDGNISDLTLSGGSVIGNEDVGALAAIDYGNVTNVHSSVAVTGFYLVGGLLGESGGIVSNSDSSGAITGRLVDVLSSGEPTSVGGLIGQVDSGSVTGSHASGNVTALGGDEIGGLIGYTNGNNGVTVSNSYATGAVDAGVDASTFTAGASVGGLIGDNGGAVFNSYATGAVLGSQFVGGLIGYNENDAPGTNAENPTGDGTVVRSFATGAVTGYVDDFGNEGISIGGLIGYNNGGVQNAYSLGAVTGGDQLGGLVGSNTGSLHEVYSTGQVSAAAGATPTQVGGLVGAGAGSDIANAYWDLDTSGINDTTQGAGDQPSLTGITGLTTTNLQASLPSEFSGSAWAIVAGRSYPYLLWQVPTGTPQVISGTVISAHGATAEAGQTVNVLIDGTEAAPLADTNSNANGYYYMLLAPGTISPSGSNILAYLTGGTPGNSYAAATNSIMDLTIREDWLLARSNASESTAILIGIGTALGGASGADFLYTASSGFISGTDFAIYDTAAAFTLDTTIDLGAGVLALNTLGSDTQTDGAITAATFKGESSGGSAFDDGGNDIRALDQFTNTGSGGFALTDGETLHVVGAVNAGTGDIALATTNGGNIVLRSGLTAGGTVTLTSAGEISENTLSGAITAATLTGSANGATRLQGANLITDLGDFSDTGGNFFLTDGQTLTVTGSVNAGTKGLTLQTTSGDLVIDGSLQGLAVTLGSSLGQVYGTGAITAGVLNVSADTGIDLDGANNTIRRIGTNTTNSGSDVIDYTR